MVERSVVVVQIVNKLMKMILKIYFVFIGIASEKKTALRAIRSDDGVYSFVR